jgi:hypothetical protein
MRGMSATQRICLVCGAPIPPSRKLSVCCSDKCRRLRDNRLCEESRVRCREKKRKNDESKRKEKANRRAAFFAARDAAFNSLGLPPERVTIAANGRRIVTRGSCFGGCAADIMHILQPTGGREE